MEFPRIEKLYRKYKDRGFVVFGVEGNSNDAATKKMLEKFDITFPVVELPPNISGPGIKPNEVREKYALGFPTSYLIDANGKLLMMHIGFKAGDEEWMEEEILKLLD